jgi:hypothetical protein
MRMIFGAIGGIKIGRGNRSTRRKPTPAPLCPTQNPTWHTRSRTPDRSSGKPATNRLSYGAAFLVPFRRLLRLAESRWRYSTLPPHGFRRPIRCRDDFFWDGTGPFVSFLEVDRGDSHSLATLVSFSARTNLYLRVSCLRNHGTYCGM